MGNKDEDDEINEALSALAHSDNYDSDEDDEDEDTDHDEDSSEAIVNHQPGSGIKLVEADNFVFGTPNSQIRVSDNGQIRVQSRSIVTSGDFEITIDGIPFEFTDWLGHQSHVHKSYHSDVKYAACRMVFGFGKDGENVAVFMVEGGVLNKPYGARLAVRLEKIGHLQQVYNVLPTGRPNSDGQVSKKKSGLPIPAPDYKQYDELVKPSPTKTWFNDASEKFDSSAIKVKSIANWVVDAGGE